MDMSLSWAMGREEGGLRCALVSVVFDSSRYKSLGQTYWFVSWRKFVSAKRPGSCI